MQQDPHPQAETLQVSASLNRLRSTDWPNLLTEWQHSGLTQKAFCRKKILRCHISLITELDLKEGLLPQKNVSVN